jgi:uncharacterized protein
MTITLPAVEERGIDLVTAGCEVREATDGGLPQFVGHASMFDTRYAIGNPLTWGFYEEVARGAFAKTIAEGDARFLIDHDTSMPVARVSAGTLRLAEDRVGLATDADLNVRKTYVSDLVENLNDKTITGMSIGFRVIKDEWFLETVSTSDGQTVDVEIRRILEAQLLEVSAVTFPASETTDAGLRTIETDRELRDVAAALVRRGDLAAFERRCAYRSELTDFRHLIPEPAAATRDDEGEPGAPTPNVDIEAKMRGLQLRYGLPNPAATTDPIKGDES